MPQRILMATDGSENSAAAARFLNRLELPKGTEIHVLAVVDAYIEALLERAEPGQMHHSRHVARDAAALLKRESLDVRCEIRSGDAAHEIVLAARERDAELVAVGSRGLTGLPGLVFGSVARNVAAHAPCSVLVCRELRHDLRQVILATDGSEHAARAAELLASLPLPNETAVTVVQGVRPCTPMVDMWGAQSAELWEQLAAAEKEQREASRELVESIRASLEARGRSAEAEVRTGDPAAEVVRAAEEHHADLIVAGARGASRIEELVIGSVADRLLRGAPCSVLLAR